MSQVPDPLLVPASNRSTIVSGNMLAMGSMIAWSMGFPAADILLQSWPAQSLVALRLAVVTAILLPLWVLIDGPRAVMGARWGRGLLVGGIAFGFGTYLLVLAQSLTDAVTVAIIASTCPLAAVIIEMVCEGRRLTKGFIVGLFATLIGGLVATGGGSMALGLGALAATGSCFLFCWGSFLTVRDFPSLSPIGRSTLTLAGGCLSMGALTLGLHMWGVDVRPTSTVDLPEIQLILFYAFAGMALSQVMWVASVGRLGVAVASFHINIAPFYVMVLVYALGGSWDLQAALGAGIVAFGVVFAQKGSATGV
ncbi:DMT family transporter [uncultured Pelagimonas sp.]|uniref:DMT family transporter n=1 Tax=uncultured Pelagimonas sp. TaxID=1618102 RepID=UPI00263506CD|nr:DMT family transporter [uncultured Pelagimonas sp.]